MIESRPSLVKAKASSYFRSVALHGGPLHGRSVRVPRDADFALYRHRMPNGRVVEYEMRGEIDAHFVKEAGHGDSV